MDDEEFLENLTIIAGYHYGMPGHQHYHLEALCITADGKPLLCGCGGRFSRYANCNDQANSTAGTAIIPIDWDTALRWADNFLKDADRDRVVEAYEWYA